MNPDTDEEAPERASASPVGAVAAGPSPSQHVVNDAIGLALQAHYRELTEAPLPDRFLVLLAELEAIDAPHK